MHTYLSQLMHDYGTSQEYVHSFAMVVDNFEVLLSNDDDGFLVEVLVYSNEEGNVRSVEVPALAKQFHEEQAASSYKNALRTYLSQSVPVTTMDLRE